MSGRDRDSRQYGEMLFAAIERLKAKDARAVAADAGLRLDESGRTFAFRSFGVDVYIDSRDYGAPSDLEMWHHLAILQYLALADGRRPGAAWVGMGDLPGGGLVRGASFDREIDAMIADRLSGCAPEQIAAACRALDGTPGDNPRADLCVDFCFMPRYPLRLNLWVADDEFPASGKLLVNDGVRHVLGVEAAGTVGMLLLEKLCRACERIGNP